MPTTGVGGEREEERRGKKIKTKIEKPTTKNSVFVLFLIKQRESNEKKQLMGLVRVW